MKVEDLLEEYLRKELKRNYNFLFFKCENNIFEMTYNVYMHEEDFHNGSFKKVMHESKNKGLNFTILSSTHDNILVKHVSIIDISNISENFMKSLLSLKKYNI